MEWGVAPDLYNRQLQQTVNVTNGPPQVGFPIAFTSADPMEPSYVGRAVFARASAPYSEEGSTCTVNYGDNTGDFPGTWYPGGLGQPHCDGPSHTYSAAGNYLITVTVVDSGGLSGSNSAPHQVVQSVHVEDIALTSKAAKGGYTFAALVTVHDWNDQPVNKAQVAAVWTFGGAPGPSMQATTNRSGVATFRGVKDGNSATICVTNVAKAGMVFEPGGELNDCRTITAP